MTDIRLLIAASALLGLDPDNPLTDFIEELVDDTDEPPEYIFVGKAGRSRVTAKQLVEFRYCDAAIAAATGEVVEHLIPREWRKARRALLGAKTTLVLGSEAGPVDGIRARVIRELRYHANFLVNPEEDIIAYALSNRYAIRIDGRVWFSVEKLLERLANEKVRHDRREVVRCLHALGISERRQFFFTACSDGLVDDMATRAGHRTSRTLWAVPEELVREALGEPPVVVEVR